MAGLGGSTWDEAVGDKTIDWSIVSRDLIANTFFFREK
jgi:hypothetical protein